MSYCYPRLMLYQPCVIDDAMSPTIYIYITFYDFVSRESICTRQYIVTDR